MRPGDLAPDFSLPDQDGTTWTLSKLLAPGPVVLFFYSRAMTYGCTAEVRHFRDLVSGFDELSANPVGISGDPIGKQRQFTMINAIDFPLLSDQDLGVAAQFGARRRSRREPIRRYTYVIDRDRLILEVIRSELRMQVHAEKALEVLRRSSRR